MQHIKITFAASTQPEKDMLTALLTDAGYDGFEETETGLLAYIEEPKYNELELTTISGNAPYHTEVVPAQNWNALWESNFEPVVVDGFCTIRAHFHNMEITTPYEIIITPKMSFGTGHHATTRLMMGLMKGLDLRDKSVLDFGTGTGVLAILAEKLGAREVLAIDNDEWAVVNGKENTGGNHCTRISVQKGSLEDIQIDHADVILANINRHILLRYMDRLFGIMNPGGQLLLSGILIEDVEILKEAAAHAGFTYKEMARETGWAALHFYK